MIRGVAIGPLACAVARSASQRAVHAEAEFIKRFGERHDANVMRKKRRHRAPVVRPARF